MIYDTPFTDEINHIKYLIEELQSDLTLVNREENTKGCNPIFFTPMSSVGILNKIDSLLSMVEVLKSKESYYKVLDKHIQQLEEYRTLLINIKGNFN